MIGVHPQFMNSPHASLAECALLPSQTPLPTFFFFLQFFSYVASFGLSWWSALSSPSIVDGPLFQVPFCIVSSLGHCDGGSHSRQVTLFRFPPRGEGSISDEQVTSASKSFDQLNLGKESLWGCQPKKILNVHWVVPWWTDFPGRSQSYISRCEHPHATFHGCLQSW